MEKIMISQPMRDKTDLEIKEQRERISRKLKMRGYEIADTLFDFDIWDLADQGVSAIPLYFLAKSLEEMSKCRAAFFCKGWEDARGCRIEHEAAKAYGLKIIYEEE